MTQHVIIQKLGRVVHVQLNRTDKRNALTHAMYAAINDAFRAASSDPETRVLVISGSEDCFSAGNDVVDFMQGGINEESPVSQFLGLISSFEKPLIAAAAGPAIGVGTTMLFHCDLVYAADDLKLETPFVNLALVPEAASSLLMPAQLGYQRAAAMLMLGESMSVQEAVVAGLVNAIVPKSELIKTALEKAQKLAAAPPTAVRLTKALMKDLSKDEIQSRIGTEARLFGERLKSPEAMEAFTAFMQKRKPDFSKFQ